MILANVLRSLLNSPAVLTDPYPFNVNGTFSNVWHTPCNATYGLSVTHPETLGILPDAHPALFLQPGVCGCVRCLSPEAFQSINPRRSTGQLLHVLHPRCVRPDRRLRRLSTSTWPRTVSRILGGSSSIWRVGVLDGRPDRRWFVG